MNTMSVPQTQLTFSDTFVVRANETDSRGFLAAPALCNYLQEIAGIHACELGLGVDALREQGVTWMMSGLHLIFDRQPGWRERLIVTTWPSGYRGRLLATRDFLVHDDDGRRVLAGISEWLMVEHATLKITRLPESLRQRVPADTPRAPVPQSDKIAEPVDPQWCTRFRVRRSDIDLNRHANNVHYVEWLLETLPDSFATRTLTRLDISYRAGAVYGDVVLSEAAPLDGAHVIHRIRREANGDLLTLARSTWAPAS